MENLHAESILSYYSLNHPRHDSSWTFRGSSSKAMCVACLIEMLEDKETLAIRKTKCLTEILLLFTKSKKLFELISINTRIGSHLCQILINLVESTHEEFRHLSTEILIQLLVGMENDILVREALDAIEAKLFTLNNYRKAYPYVIVIGRIIDGIPLLVEEIVHCKKTLWEYLMSGLSFPDEKTVSGLFYLAIGVFRNDKVRKSMPKNIKLRIIKSCCDSLITCKTKETKVNALALLRKCLESEGKECLLKLLTGEHHENQYILSNALKKLVLSSDNGLQIGGIQLTTYLLGMDSTNIVTGAFLKNGLAEFLLEALESNTDLIHASLFCCLNELCKTPEFFTSGYSIYSIDSILSAVGRSINLQNADTLQKGLHLLSTIISKQQNNVPLFANCTTLDKCLSVADECLKSMDYKVLLEALSVVKSLLRVDQIPMGFDVKKIVTSLNNVIAVARKFTGTNVENFSSMQSDAAQDLLTYLLEVIFQVSVFNEDYSQQSLSIEDVLLAEDSQISNKQAFNQALEVFVMKSIDETCIPAVMFNYEDIKKSSLFELFFKLLNSQLMDKEKEKCVVFAQKLVNGSFLQVSIEISGRFCKGGDNFSLMKEIQQFQKNLFMNLIDGFSSNKKLIEMFDFEGVPGSSNEYLSLLSQSCMDPGNKDVSDTLLFNIQCYCIEILYLSYIYKDHILDEKSIIQGLHQFICVNSNLKILPPVILKHLLMMYIHITIEYNCNSLDESKKIIQFELLKLNSEEFSLVSCLTSNFIEWIFQNEELANKFGYSLLISLFSTETLPKDNISKFLANKIAVKVIFSLIEHENEVLVNKAAKMIESIGEHFSQSNESIDPLLLGSIAHDLHKLFLKNQGTRLPDHVLLAMLRVLQAYQMMIAPQVDIKTFHLAIDILTKHTSSEIIVAALNYANLVLWLSMESGNNSFAAILLSNKELISWVQIKINTLDVIQSLRIQTSPDISVLAACMIFVSNLSLFQGKYGLPTSSKIFLTKKDLITQLKVFNSCHDDIVKMAFLLFWTAFFNSKTNRFLNISEESGGSASKFTQTDCKIVFALLQNIVMLSSNPIRCCVISCLEAFLSSAERANYCNSNLWNKTVLESLLFSLPKESLDCDLVMFCKLMISFNGIWDMVETTASACEHIARLIPNVCLELDSQGSLPALAVNCITFLKKLLHVDLSLFKVLIEIPVLTWIKNAKDKASQSNAKKKLCFLKNGQLIFPEKTQIFNEIPDVKEIIETLKILEKRH